MKYNIKAIMKRAWEIKKENKLNVFGLCLKMAWFEAKEANKSIMNKKIKELQIKIKKYNEKIEKKESLISKRENQIVMAKSDYDAEEYKTSIINAKNEIVKMFAQIDKVKAQLKKEYAKENAYRNSPKVFKILEKELTEKWTEFDKQYREKMREERKNLGYVDFFKKHSGADYEMISKTDEEILKKNAKDARNLVIDLYQRVNDITGPVKNWAGIYYSKGCLNGIVIGEKGKAKVESVLAGGYNVQKLHVRVLVHKVK